MFKQFSSLVLILSMTVALFAQKNDPVLFTVEKKPIHLSEFKYIYTKTNGDKADFSKASLEEYLDLYIKFKLKVQRAKALQLDTIPSLQSELAGYRRQLANSYLVDKEVTEKLVKEAYDRTQNDVDISHIMVALAPNASPSETETARAKIMDIKKKLDESGLFDQLAAKFSEDTYTKDKGGRLGYFAAMFREGFYEMETVSYNLEPGAYSEPVRTAAGFHIIKLNKKRPARGEMEVGHILIRHGKDKNNPSSKNRVDSLYQALKGGANFEELARKHSQHVQTATKGGYIGFVTTNSPVEESFKDASFALTKDDSFTEPVESSVGWHIIRRISKKVNEPYEVVKRRLQTKIQNNARGKAKEFSRQQLAKDAMIERIKREGQFNENPVITQSFMSSLDSNFVTHRWKRPAKNDQAMFTFGKKMDFTVSDFVEFCKRSAIRLRMGKKANPLQVAEMIYQDFVDDSALKFEEAQLESKYPEFKSLMREYEEGILLFEATKILVWDKASQDSVGLKAFHETQKNKYQWGDRAIVDVYTLRAGNEDKLNELRKLAVNSESKMVLEKFNEADKVILTVQEKVYEKGKNETVDKMPWREGAISETTVNDRNKASSFMVLKTIKGPGEKTLSEARGYVIADYQDFLEKEWLKELRSTYKVDVKQDVFDGLIKK
ncbi:MAG: peptidylprolyl isomerase [Bacteroidota bacterium]